MRHRLALLFGLLTLCAVLVGCGGSGTTATATTAPAPTTAPTRAATSAPAATSVPAATTAPAAAATSAPGATTAPAATSAPTTAAAAAAPAASGNAVAVELKDFAITLNTSTVSAGMVTFTVKNNGPSPHNFNVGMGGSDEKGVATLDPGKTAMLMLDLKPGTYTYRCNIPGHDLLGMKGTLTVK